MTGPLLLLEWDTPVKKSNSSLIRIWSAASLSLAAGLLLTLHSLSGIPRTTALWERKTSDIRSLADMRSLARRQQLLLTNYSRHPATATRLEDLTRIALPGHAITIRTMEILPSLPGWTTRKVTLELTNISGEDLGKWLDAATAAKPPWAPVECILSASSTPGHLAKASLVMETAERNP